MEDGMANDSTDNGIMGGKVKGPYKHPDFPEMSIEELRAKAVGFDIDAHLVALMFQEPFHADVLRSLHKQSTEDITTAGVLAKDGIMQMWFNPLFLAAYDNIKVRGVMKHEAYHLELEHTTTRRYQPHDIWNWATDLAINSTLSEDEMPPCGLRPGKALQPPKEWPADTTQEKIERFQRISALIESFPLNLASEEYFGRLMENEDVQQMVEEGTTYVIGEGNGMDDHDGWDSLSDEEREYMSGKVRQAVKEAMERADSRNSWGSVPAQMREEIRRKVRGEIDWKAVLRNFVGATQRADRSTSVLRVNKKYPGIHAGSTRDYRPTIASFIDQSGSVDDGSLELLFGELQSLASRADFVLYHFDTEVDKDSRKKWSRGRVQKAHRTRCGGTDFDAPTKWVNEGKEKCEALIILTDGCAPKPVHSRVRRCWVLIPGSKLEFEPDARDVVVQLKKRIA
jgi:predicted metal-dependent peptidase